MHWLALLCVPVWIFAITALIRAVILTTLGDGWWRFPLYMALVMPLWFGGIIGAMFLALFALGLGMRH